MDWLWLLSLPLVPLGLALVLPVRLRLVSQPLELEARWGLLGFRLEGRPQGLAKRVGLSGLWFELKDQPEPPPRGLERGPAPQSQKAASSQAKKRKKKKPKKAAQRKLKLGLAEARMLLKHPVPRLLLRRLKSLGLGALKAVRFDRAQVVYGGLDPFGQGILAALAALAPKLKRLTWASNFLGETQVQLELKLLTWRLAGALLRFLLGLPYLKAYKLYRSLLQPQPAESP